MILEVEGRGSRKRCFCQVVFLTFDHAFPMDPLWGVRPHGERFWHLVGFCIVHKRPR